MLPLSDPLWKKLDDAHRDRDIPALLSGLAETWDDEEAKSLLWDCLCHQETCYGATYGAIPHLLKIAQPDGSRQQRLDIALFVGFVARCALVPSRRQSDEVDSDSLPGLPRTIEEWDRKLDCFRSLVAMFEDPNRTRSPYSHYEQAELLPRYRKLLALEPVHAGDLEKIGSIRADFFAALPAIRAVCERALLENLHEEFAVLSLLGGIAAADGLVDLACLFNFGADGRLQCSSCGGAYQYMLFGDRVAVYADDERALRDYNDSAPSRSDGFIVPVGSGESPDTRITALLRLADRAASTKPALLLRNFLGTFHCCKCGTRANIDALGL
jgi:hypothetical protein